MHRRSRLSTAGTAPARRTAAPAGAVVVGAVVVGAVVVGAALLAGCDDGTAVTAAPGATDPACAAALRQLPPTVLSKAPGPSPAEGSAAWGDPAIVLRCGLPEQGPTTRPCVTVNEVDWVIDDSGDPLRFVTYGRAPAMEVLVPTAYGRQNATGALVDVAVAAQALPRTSHRCTGL